MKAQTALEYLMTYGWAILVIVIVIGALYAAGLTRPCRWLGTQVREFPDFSVENVKTNTTYLSIDVNYIRTGRVGLERVTVERDATGTATTVPNLPPATRVNVPLTWAAGIGSRGDCYSFDAYLTYNISVAGGFERLNTTGRISGVVS